jgi:hypothetical protein
MAAISIALVALTLFVTTASGVIASVPRSTWTGLRRVFRR